MPGGGIAGDVITGRAAFIQPVEAGQFEFVIGRGDRGDDTPVQIADSYIPLEIAAGTAIEDTDSGPGGIISRFADLGLGQTRITEEVDIRPPSPDEAEFLEMSPDQRVYDVTHAGWTTDGRAVEVCLHVMPAHQWRLEYEWPTDQQPS